MDQKPETWRRLCDVQFLPVRRARGHHVIVATRRVEAIAEPTLLANLLRSFHDLLVPAPTTNMNPLASLSRTCLCLFVLTASTKGPARASAQLLRSLETTTDAPTTAAPTTAPPTAAPVVDNTNAFGNPDPQNGPWPECVGWQGEDCANYIQGETTDSVSAEVMDEIQPDIHRVVIRVDENNVVISMPKRG